MPQRQVHVCVNDRDIYGDILFDRRYTPLNSSSLEGMFVFIQYQFPSQNSLCFRLDGHVKLNVPCEGKDFPDESLIISHAERYFQGELEKYFEEERTKPKPRPLNPNRKRKEYSFAPKIMSDGSLEPLCLWQRRMDMHLRRRKLR